MNPLNWATITEDMRAVLRDFSRSTLGDQFYLAGGTALSLQLGHRQSIDLGFFTPTEDVPSIRPVLEKALSPWLPALADSRWGNLVYVVNNIRVGFYGYGYPMVAPMIETEGVRLASIEDIALMKLDALLARAARKDFYDLYFICQSHSLRNLLDLAPQKYPSVRDFESQAVKRLVYFENAEYESEPVLFVKARWEEVKQYFIQQAKEIEQSWLR